MQMGRRSASEVAAEGGDELGPEVGGRIARLWSRKSCACCIRAARETEEAETGVVRLSGRLESGREQIDLLGQHVWVVAVQVVPVVVVFVLVLLLCLD